MNAILVIASPVGEPRKVTYKPDRRAISLFVAGSVLSATVVGFGLAVVGTALNDLNLMKPIAVVVAGAGAVYGLSGALRVKIRVPSGNWFVPKEWAIYGPTRAPLMFGLALGTGFLTQVTYAGYYVLLVGCAYGGRLITATIMMSVFGLSRGASVAVAAAISQRLKHEDPFPNQLHAADTMMRPSGWT